MYLQESFIWEVDLKYACHRCRENKDLSQTKADCTVLIYYLAKHSLLMHLICEICKISCKYNVNLYIECTVYLHIDAFSRF